MYAVLPIFAILFCAFSLFVIERLVIYPTPHKEYVELYSNEYSLSPYLVYSVIKVESNFNTKATSSKGAKGLMQITTLTGEYIARELAIEDYDLYAPKDNVKFGCFYLNYLINKFKSVETALIAYNAGEGNVRSWLKNKEYSTDGVNLEVIPFRESDIYIKKINKTLDKYKKLYGNILDKTLKKK